jgi:hypothetical protein
MGEYLVGPGLLCNEIYAVTLIMIFVHLLGIFLPLVFFERNSYRAAFGFYYIETIYRKGYYIDCCGDGFSGIPQEQECRS